MWFEFIISSQVGQNFSFEQTTFALSFFWQLSAFAINRAVVVLPTPLIPVRRYAFGVLPILIALLIVCDHTLLTDQVFKFLRSIF